jgi:hypothetical protein
MKTKIKGSTQSAAFSALAAFVQGKILNYTGQKNGSVSHSAAWVTFADQASSRKTASITIQGAKPSQRFSFAWDPSKSRLTVKSVNEDGIKVELNLCDVFSPAGCNGATIGEETAFYTFQPRN